MFQVFVGSFLLSAVHAAIPNHWIPFVALARSEQWTARKALAVTTICGAAHTLSTILIGLLVGLVGYRLSEQHELITRYIAPIILVLVGLTLVALDARGKQHHHEEWRPDEHTRKRSTTWIVLSLSVAMFFSPCLEIEAYYFTAGVLGWTGILVVSVTYFVLTIAGMVLLVYFALHGIKRLEWHFLEHHERAIAGAILVLLGLGSYFLKH